MYAVLCQNIPLELILFGTFSVVPCLDNRHLVSSLKKQSCSRKPVRAVVSIAADGKYMPAWDSFCHFFDKTKCRTLHQHNRRDFKMFDRIAV